MSRSTPLRCSKATTCHQPGGLPDADSNASPDLQSHLVATLLNDNQDRRLTQKRLLVRSLLHEEQPSLEG